MAKEKTGEEDEIWKDLEKVFSEIDKKMEKLIGKMCPDFEPLCAQCRLNLIYNKFKKDIYDEMLLK